MPSKSDKFKAKQQGNPGNTPRRRKKKRHVNRMLKQHRRKAKRDHPMLTVVVPSVENECEGCTLCCKIMAVDDTTPPTLNDTWCEHCDKGAGCTVWADTESGYGNGCSDFECVWLQSKKAHLAGDKKAASMCLPALRPDRSKVVLMPTTDEGKTGIVCHVDITSPMAYKDEPLWSILRALMQAGKMVLIRCGNERRVIGGEEDPRVKGLAKQRSTGATAAPPAANS